MKYSIGAAARSTGVSEHRLRTWERRYRVPEPERTESGRRLYDESDLDVIRLMARLIEAGVLVGDAAEAARQGGREVVDLPEASPVSPSVERLLAASARYDDAEIARELHREFEQLGVRRAITEVVMPFLLEVGNHWQRATMTVGSEHLSSEVVRRFLVTAAPEAIPPDGGPVVVLACPPGEQHDLGLLALWLLLQDSPVRCIYLGADVPASDVLAACSAVSAQAVVLVATSAATVPGLWLTARRLIAARTGCRVFAGGPGIDRLNDPSAVIGELMPHNLDEAATWVVERLR